MTKIRINDTDVYMVRMSAKELEDLIRALETVCDKALEVVVESVGAKAENEKEAIAEWQLYSDCLARLRGNTFVV